jgi:hypothetical protein
VRFFAAEDHSGRCLFLPTLPYSFPLVFAPNPSQNPGQITAAPCGIGLKSGQVHPETYSIQPPAAPALIQPPAARSGLQLPDSGRETRSRPPLPLIFLAAMGSSLRSAWSCASCCQLHPASGCRPLFFLAVCARARACARARQLVSSCLIECVV